MESIIVCSIRLWVSLRSSISVHRHSLSLSPCVYLSLSLPYTFPSFLLILFFSFPNPPHLSISLSLNIPHTLSPSLSSHPRSAPSSLCSTLFSFVSRRANVSTYRICINCWILQLVLLILDRHVTCVWVWWYSMYRAMMMMMMIALVGKFAENSFGKKTKNRENDSYIPTVL